MSWNRSVETGRFHGALRELAASSRVSQAVMNTRTAQRVKNALFMFGTRRQTTRFDGSKYFIATLASPLNTFVERVLGAGETALFRMHSGSSVTYAYHVYVDVAALIWSYPIKEVNRYIERLVDAGLEDRAMSGTDQLLWSNAARFLRLDTAQGK